MKTIYQKLFFICLLITGILFLQKQDFNPQEQPSKLKPKSSQDYIVQVQTKQKTLQVPLDDYLVGVIAGEMPASFEVEALKAQAVASRTFVLSRNLKVDNTTNSQVYLSDEQMKKNWGKSYDQNKEKIQKAVKDTHNQVLTYKGDYISALFFSSSNGNTVNCGDYFAGDKVYLKAVNSKWDIEEDPQFIRTKTFTKKQLANIFGIDSVKMQIMSYTKSGYVQKVIVNNKEYSGREIREKLNLASSCFQIVLTSKGYKFITKGSGHGVGMSQYGAQGMAKENKNYKDILNHYYQNVDLTSI